MKIRTGFVSNSSSSSFICHGQKIGKIAKSMLKTIAEDWEELNIKRLKQNLLSALKDKRVLEGEMGIRLPSCNYDTYILQVGKDVFVATSNNHIWDFEGDSAGDYYDEENELRIKIDGATYFNIENGITHSHPVWCEGKCGKCPKCGENIYECVTAKGEKICGHCFKGKADENS